MSNIEIKKTYEVIKGLVYGTYWGGGSGCYSISKNVIGLIADTPDELRDIVTKQMNESSIDGGMGFQSEDGFILSIKEVDTITLKDKDYSTTVNVIEIYSEGLSPEAEDFLLDALIYNFY
jgi:hypothetical protein